MIGYIQIYHRAKNTGTPSHRKRSGRPVSFNDAEKQELIAFVTRDRRTRRLSWEEITAEMGCACSAKTVQRVVQSMGFHKRVPRKKFNVRPDNRPRRVHWARGHLSWTYEEWKRALWTDESSFSAAGFGHRPWVIRKPEGEYHPDCINEVFGQGRQRKMVWGGFVEVSSLILSSFLGKKNWTQ